MENEVSAFEAYRVRKLPQAKLKSNTNMQPKKMMKKKKKKSAKQQIIVNGAQSPTKTANLHPTPAKRLKLSKLANNGSTTKSMATVEKIELGDSIRDAAEKFQWLLAPMPVEEFMAKHWEKGCCKVKKSPGKSFDRLISTELINEALLNNHVEFSTNIDITSYENGERLTHNPEGRAMPATVWNHFNDGCSIRILNPITYFPELRKISATLQEYFQCLVGANAYLTPPHSQGFAPHYDDIEAFVLQVEGRKVWRVYNPPTQKDQLCRVSSGNLKNKDLGKPILEVVLSPGEMLYFPRGFVHQAVTQPNYHSLHVTLSVYQKQAYADLMEIMMPKVMERAINATVPLRRGLPLHMWRHLGIAHAKQSCKERKELQAEIADMFEKHFKPKPADIDAAVDQLATRFQHQALPPVLNEVEMQRTIYGARCRVDNSGICNLSFAVKISDRIRLLRANVLRLVFENPSWKIYYYVDNDVEFCKYDPNFIEIDRKEVDAIEILITSYPKFIKVEDLPLNSSEDRLELARALWEHGLVMTEQPAIQSQ